MKNISTILIVSAGNVSDRNIIDKFLSISDLLIYVDGGANNMKDYSCSPNILVGDFDSIETDLLDMYSKASDTKVIRLDTEKDMTDTRYAIDLAIDMNPKKIYMFGCIGDRIDHCIANIGLLNLCMYRTHVDSIATIIDTEFSIEIHCSPFIISNSDMDIGGVFSIIAYGDHVDNLSIFGSKYELCQYRLEYGDGRTISNVYIGQPVYISFERGNVLCYKQHKK